MKKTLRFLCIALVSIMACGIFSGCSGRKDGYPPVWTSDKKVVMTVGGYNVTEDFYRYLFLNTKQFYDNGDDSYWQKEGNDVEKVKDYVFKSIAETYAMFALADKYNITLDDADEQYIDDFIESSKEGYSDEEYKKSLEESFMTDELYRFILRIQQLELKVFEHITAEESGIILVDDNALTEALKTDFVRATHILFTFKNATEATTQLEKAKGVLERLKNGEDFEKLKDEYSADTDLKGNKDGYYFTHGEFENEFEYTAFELEEGELSEVVLSPVGYHIIKRLPLEEEYINDNFEQLRRQHITALYYEMLDETAESFTPEYTAEYKDIQLDSFN